MLKRNFLYFVILISLFITAAQAQTTGFVYQGKLSDGAAAANGTYQFQFKLFDAAAGGNQVGQTIMDLPATVTNGIFSVTLDFGANAYDGSARFLEISVRLNNSGQAYTLLNPRQAVASTPYAVRSLNANQAITANNSANLGGIPAAQYTKTTDPRLSDDRNPLPNSPNYIQNSANQQASSNFNISGEGKANILSAATQFNIGANRVLTATAQNNLFAGVNTGAANTTGYQNAIFGNNAGAKNTIGFDNSFFGNFSGNNNLGGSGNSFFGAGSGVNNLGGSSNAFFGMEAGIANTSGTGNTFVGRLAGVSNTTENNNTFIGFQANGAAGITNATALGYNAKATQSNTMVLGTSAVTVQVPGNLTVANTFSANALDSATVYKIGGARILSNGGTDNLFAGIDSGNANTGGFNAFFGAQTGKANTSGFNNTFVGAYAGRDNLSGANNAFFGASSGLSNSTGGANSFFGANAGFSNTDGANNSFFGNSAGFNNTGGDNNSFFGRNSGQSNLTGNDNAFFGTTAGQSNTTGGSNTFLGNAAGLLNKDGFFNVFVGKSSAFSNSSGNNNTFVGYNSGSSITTGNNNVFIGSNAGSVGNVSNAIAIGAGAQVSFSNSAVIGTANTTVNIPGTLKAEKSFSALSATLTNDLTVNGSASVGGSLEVTGGISGGNFSFENGNLKQTSITQLLTNGAVMNGMTFVQKLKISTLFPTAGNADLLCLATDDNTVRLCNLLFIQMKNTQDFRGGLDVIKNLRPVTYDANGSRNVGLMFADPNAANSLFARRDGNEVTGVRQQEVVTALVSATQEQQTQIEAQTAENQQLRTQVKQLQTELEALKAIVCATNGSAAVCQPKQQ